MAKINEIYNKKMAVLYNIAMFICIWFFIEILFRVLNIIGILSVLNTDLVPFFSVNNIGIVYLVIVISYTMLISISMHFKVYVKKYYCIVILIAFFLAEIYFYKIEWIGDKINVCTVIETILVISELIFIYFFTLHISMQEFSYSDTFSKNANSSNVEEAVFGRDKLQKVQIKALNKIIDVIDNMKSDEGINIALIAEWGKGKTSIINTLIGELEEKNRDNQYFIIKINCLSLGETVNLVQYVNNYFSWLFSKYIPYTFNNSSNNYFAILIDSLKEDGISGYGKHIFKAFFNHGFIDSDHEKNIFSDRVQKLLDASRRKNILLIVDDLDRIENTDRALQLISEFSSTRGIISLISLSEKNDLLLKPGSFLIENENEKKNVGVDSSYTEWDKYIHLRIRIESETNAEYDNIIKKVIIDEYDSVMKRKQEVNKDEFSKNRYIICQYLYHKPSILGYGQSTLRQDNGNVLQGILTEIFFENFKKSSLNLGEYIEEIVMDYQQHSFQLNDIELDEKTKTKVISNYNMAWCNIKGSGYWLSIITTYSRLFLELIQRLYIGIESINPTTPFSNLQDVLLSGKIKENEASTVPVSNVTVSAYDNFILQTLFSESNEMEEINKIILNNKTDAFSDKLHLKKLTVLTMVNESLIIEDFIKYLRSVIVNPRTLKMQLREASLLQLNYLDYLLEDFVGTKNIVGEIEYLKRRYPCIENEQVRFEGLKNIIDEIIFSKFITNYGEKINDKFSNSPIHIIWLYNLNEEKFIVISGRSMGKNKHIIMHIDGEIVDEISIEKLVDEFYCKYYKEAREKFINIP